MKSAFTLVEVLIVLSVIAGIMTIITPMAMGASKRAKIRSVAFSLRNTAQALTFYMYTKAEKMSSASETDLSWLTVGFLVNDNDLSVDPGNIEIEWPDGDISDGTATARVEYTGGDLPVSDLKEAWDEIDDDDNDSNPDVVRNFTKYW